MGVCIKCLGAANGLLTCTVGMQWRLLATVLPTRFASCTGCEQPGRTPDAIACTQVCRARGLYQATMSSALPAHVHVLTCSTGFHHLTVLLPLTAADQAERLPNRCSACTA